MNDIIPKQICTKCLSELVQMYYFLNKAVSAYDSFAKYFDKNQDLTQSGETSDNKEPNEDTENDDDCAMNETNDHDYSATVEDKSDSEISSVERDYNSELFGNIQVLKVKEENSGKNTFSCDLCSKKFFLFSSLEKHVEEHEKNEYFMCFCGKEFSKRDVFEQHIKLHKEGPPKRESYVKRSKTVIIDKDGQKNVRYSCTKCDNIYLTVHKLRQHIRQSHVEPNQIVWERKSKKPINSTCSMCFKVFTTKAMVNEHDCKPFCKGCNSSFESKTEFQEHIKTHHSKGLYHCSVCSQVFTKSYDLTIHKRTHEDK